MIFYGFSDLSAPLQYMYIQAISVDRLAKIDLVTIFDCVYRWYCTIDYVIVNYIGINHLFYNNDFLAINHLLCIKDKK